MPPRITLFLLIALALLPLPARAAPTISLLGGSAFPQGADATRLDRGLACELRVSPFGTQAMEPFVRVHWQRMLPTGDGVASILVGGYLVPAQLPARIERTSLDVGVARRFALGPVQCSLEGATGIDWVHPTPIVPAFRNDRRPDPALPPDPRVGGVGATMSLGAGLRVPLAARVALDASVATQGTTVNGLGHMPLALLAGATWPAGNDLAPGDAKNGWRLRLAAGPAWRLRPDHDAEKARVGQTMAASLVRPYDAHFAFELAGAWAQVSAEDRLIARQERDQFGNLANVYIDAHPTWSLAAVAPCVRASTGAGPWRAWSHAGVGYGHTGGDGATTSVPYFDLGTFRPVEVEVRSGFGRAAGGASWLAGAGIERDLPGRVAVLLEAEGWGVSTRYADVALATLRAGIELR